MPSGTDGSAGATDGGSGEGRTSLPTSQLPWGQIPHFTAGVTDLEDYAKKLMFLHSIWPEDAISHLAPRAALQCDPVAFKKVSKMVPDRLKSKDGCEAILNALGMQWGRFQSEDRYVKFERALFLPPRSQMRVTTVTLQGMKPVLRRSSRRTRVSHWRKYVPM